MVKRVLMIAYHFPPQAGSSGVQRTLRFSQYLPEFGWEPTILTAHPRAYPRIEGAQEMDTPKVYRAFALDASRHLAVKGRYLQASALPDRWSSWWLGAVPLGLHLARRLRFDAIWSTYPIATAHMIGHTLARRTGLPWLADFRDPMTEPGFPPDPRMHRAYGKVERATLAQCTRAVFTTRGARAAYLANFTTCQPERLHVIENGYDEADFVSVEQAPLAKDRARRPFTLLHSGIVYPSERDPDALFGALADLKRTGMLAPASFRLVLRAPVHVEALRAALARHGVADLVEIAPPLPYREALREMLAADALLVLQAANCNNQIPAKLYEYLRAQRPIVALTDDAGDTAQLLRAAGVQAIAPLDARARIAQLLPVFIEQVKNGEGVTMPVEQARKNSRRARTEELAHLLDTVAA
ncbi:MAG TPA: glycosyltransferase [Burkholderiaceae bacterium]